MPKKKKKQEKSKTKSRGLKGIQLLNKDVIDKNSRSNITKINFLDSEISQQKALIKDFKELINYCRNCIQLSCDCQPIMDSKRGSKKKKRKRKSKKSKHKGTFLNEIFPDLEKTSNALENIFDVLKLEDQYL